ncbi:MAG TPA: hypothetical protein VH143_22230 [Kofleriaceae bacterium]|jgi:hypothetical protein|nr:hypothetical protein [Kofleriaceae bacterium]
MTERDACALLKARFEQAGYAITENITLDEHGVNFEIDGYDAGKRVGYEYVTEEAGDSWDVDGDVIDALDAARRAGELFVLVVNEVDAPDAGSLGKAAAAFIACLTEKKPAKKKTASVKAPAKKKPAKHK